jgi:catechol 2,3-dioxygenase-like lactoylglutathione lyase family enzyme
MTSARKIRLAAPSYVIYEHPDLATFRRFATDFGLEEAGSTHEGAVVYLKGYGTDPYVYVARQAASGQPKRFLGAGFVAASEDDFERALHADGAESLNTDDIPGKGRAVRLRDPNGNVIEVVFGQQRQTLPPHGLSNLVGQPAVNGALDKRRQGERMIMIAIPLGLG